MKERGQGRRPCLSLLIKNRKVFCSGHNGCYGAGFRAARNLNQSKALSISPVMWHPLAGVVGILYRLLNGVKRHILL